MKHLLFISLAAASLFLQSCKRDRCEGQDLSPVMNEYNISDDNKAKIPYTGKDTLVFVSDASDTATLIGQGKEQYYEESRDNANTADCQKWITTKYENIVINFTGGGQINTIKFHVFKNDFSPKELTGFNININNQINEGDGFPYSLPVADSILLNGIYVSGGYIDNVILYNSQYGILKLNGINSHTWVKIK